MSCFCYILECSDGTLYTGWTNDPERRLAQHNKGVGARYTKTRRPVRLVYLEEQPDKVSALKRELAIKRMKRGQKVKLIEGKAHK
jgi:putative endonuclease